jgi:hypothetical protein
MTAIAIDLLQRLQARPSTLKTLPTPATPKTPKPKAKKKERIDTTFLKARGQLHVRELIAEFFPEGHESKSGYWIAPEFRISLSTGCVWTKSYYSRSPMGDVLTLFLIGRGFLTLAKPLVVPEGLSRIEELKLRIASAGSRSPGYGYEFIPEGFAKGVEAFSTWLEQFPARSEIHELLAYDS